MDIAIYTLTSELHDEQAVNHVTDTFLSSLAIEYIFRGSDYADYGSHALNLIFVRTGGTEGVFVRLLPQLMLQSDRPFYLLTSGKSNSLAASMEILSYLRQQGMKGEIIHGTSAVVSRRLQLLATVEKARQNLRGVRLGIIGRPSDWLIASNAEAEAVKQRIGIDLIDVQMADLLSAVATSKESGATNAVTDNPYLPGANHIYNALKTVLTNHHLQGFTLRCFDLLTAVKNTGCLALARLNSEGYVAGCEGDVPTMLTMMIVRSLTGVSGFQANPSFIDTETGEIVFAHCTIPLDMVERYEFDTHFESGIGVAIRGFMREGDVTIFKASGDLTRCFIAEGQLVTNLSEPDLCRTQQKIRLCDGGQASYFLTQPIGNHHVIVPGHHKALFESFIRSI